MAQAYAEMLNCGLAIVAKERKTATEVEASRLVGEVNGKIALMVDDLTTTAGTLCSAAELLKQQGAQDIYAAVSHACVTNQGIERLKKSSIVELVTTDTVPYAQNANFPITILSVAELLGDAIMRIHENRSVTSLFRLQ